VFNWVYPMAISVSVLFRIDQSCDRSVVLVTSYGLEDRGFIPGRGQVSLIFTTSVSTLETTQFLFSGYHWIFRRG
jgi:hypothetical protein